MDEFIDKEVDLEVKVKPSTEARYECPITGAHFNFNDMCARISKLHKEREL